ncbi:putative cyclin-dependent serine/threonine-protein kinase DDB_G0272797/DDB_G0274007 [Drosophila nasuta]|uniref:Cyclin-dependent serine/threonine-protein kinase DDB_G0272797/DDB_G0274007 n=1 Tax=Drosophila albomicans TaxID=7291 RepID=A0A6P8WSR5_DROAB|nr:putative cyclin-dependent serine/threonine-protein kinase DDB_G0272797/DDB_G0274007 [Drosophila albomicans]XP_060651666.1 putative cyclin-dependent serine/threonine-protein kinase DDB_G0272797/DDB_G0274007 [Drosophila nasuta]
MQRNRHLALVFLLAIGLCAACVHAAATGAPSATATTEKPKGFSSRSLDVSAAGDLDDDFETQAQTHLAYRQQLQQQQQRPQYEYSEEDQEEAPRQVYLNRNVQKQQQQQSNYLKKKPSSEESEEEEEEVEEPDRLSTLLSKSSFTCNERNSGYYADESLSCEVFHYCQENQKHSWICPEGFTFHQIHLICMPPSHDNICKQSSKYHIVNDYLYKPINLQEHQSKPNVTLRYSERYFPENYYEHERYDDEEEELPAPRPRIQHQPQQQQQPQRQPIAYHPQPQAQPQLQLQLQHQPQVQRVQYQPQSQVVTQIRHQQPQPTTIAYRKPLPTTTIQPQIQPQLQLHQLHQQQRPQTLAPTVTPAPYRFFTAAPPQLQHLHQQQQQQHQQQVFRTPEEINISLQQRRPQVFIATSTPRYYEDEYLYERRK